MGNLSLEILSDSGKLRYSALISSFNFDVGKTLMSLYKEDYKGYFNNSFKKEASVENVIGLYIERNR